MYILAIETTGAFASVALAKDDKIIGHMQGNDRFSHLQNLMPQIEKVIKDNQLSLNDVDAIAVSCGPGSFTGIRIGVSTARALAQILSIPCVAVSSLQALSMRASELSDCKDRPDENTLTDSTLICPILDARRSQVYGGGYYLENGYPVEIIKAAPYKIEEFMSKTQGYDRILLLGDGADACSDKIKQLRKTLTQTAPQSIRYQDAATVAKLGMKLLAETGGVEYYMLQPEYMRIAEAERKLKEKQELIKAQV